MRFSIIFSMIQISLPVVMPVCLCIECNAYDDDDSCLKIEQWSGEKHNGHHPMAVLRYYCCKVSTTAKLPLVGTGISGVTAVCADMSSPVSRSSLVHAEPAFC